MQSLNLALAIVAGAVLALTLLSGWVKQHLWASEALACLLVGMAIGPYGLDVFALDVPGNEAHVAIVEQTARLTLALSVMSAALSLPARFFPSHWRRMVAILLAGTLIMWITASAMVFTFLNVTLLVALLAGAIVTPTDPVLARSIVSGKLAEEKVPSTSRSLITAESGANDGLALPVVMLPLMLMDEAGGVAERSISYLLWEVGGALVLGLAMGYATGFIFRLGYERGFTETSSLTATTLALALASLGAVALLGADGLLAVFVAGLMVNRAIREEHEEQHEHFQDAVDRSLTLPVFVLLGVVAPVDLWAAHGWPLILAAASIVMFRRLPLWLALHAVTRAYHGHREALFAGWFGPVGVAALFYATFAMKHDAAPIIWPLVTLAIAMSVLVHGVTATPLTRLYARALDDRRSVD